ncbi:MAG: hypothetical protein RJB13_53 [Pseudomonadota bacterium]
MKLFMIPSCPFVQRVLIGCRVRGISNSQLKTEQIDLSNPPSQLLSVNPTGSVPTLVNEDGSGFHESHAVMQFLDSLDAQGPKLFGISPFEVARTQAQLELLASRVLGPIQQALYTKGNLNLLRTAASQLTQCFEHLDEALKDSGGPFLGGSQLSAVDISLAPFLVRLPILFELYPWIPRPERESRSTAYLDAIRGHEAVQGAMPSEEDIRTSVVNFSLPDTLLSNCINAPRTLLKNQQTAVSESNGSLTQWRVEHDGKGYCLKAKFDFKSHSEAVAFLSWLHDAQETTDHHTSISMYDFQFAEITMVTHEPQWGISEKDLALAKAIQNFFSGYKTK